MIESRKLKLNFTIDDETTLSHKRIDFNWFKTLFASLSKSLANSWILSLGNETLNDDNFL